MIKKKVLILGASRYNSKSIEAAKRAGYYVIALDRAEDVEGFMAADAFEVIDIIDKEAVLAAAKKHRINGIIPVNEFGVPVAAYVASKLGLPGISEETAILATNKEAMRKRWMEKGIPCPKVETGLTETEIKAAIGKVGLPCILKPAHGIGGASRGVIVIRKPLEIEEAIQFSQSFYEDKTTLIESLVEAELEHSAEVIVHKGVVHILAISDKIKTPLPYRVDKNVLYPTAVSGDRLVSLKEVIANSVLALGITEGPAHVELATTAKGFVLFELGARSGGGGTPEPIVPYATGIQQFEEIVRILSGDQPVNLFPTRNYGCNYHFITPKEGIIKEIKGLNEILSMDGVLDFGFFKKPGEQISAVKVGGDRSGFIISAGETREEAYKIGSLAEQKLKITYED